MPSHNNDDLMTGAKLIKLEGNEVTFKLDQLPNIERLKTMYGDDLSKVVADVRFADPRRATPQQRALFFALIGDISKWSDTPTDYLKDYFYNKYRMATYGGEISLKDTTESTVSEVSLLLNQVIEFMFEFNVPFEKGYELLPREESYYLFLCIKYRKCILCGKKADIHHVDALGMGSNRTKSKHLKHHFMALCRTHHQEIEQIGRPAFAIKYFVPVDGIKIDLPTLQRLHIQGDYSND